MNRQQAGERLSQIARDLVELDVQMAQGEIDQIDGDRLRAAYLAERDLVTVALAEVAPTPVRSPRRMAWGAGILVVAVAVAIGIAGQFTQTRQDGPVMGLANQEFDLEDVSNEQMEAVIAAYADDPAVADLLPRMRFRLAERYFAEGDYSAAFGHYDQVIRANADPDITSVSLARVAWMVWQQERDPDLPLGLLDQSLGLDPTNPETLYVKAQVLWCGADRPAEAETIISDLIDDASLPTEVIEQMKADLAAITAGESC